MAEGIRLSQCMIVKNEEKNIRQALSWGKDILWEQIVVDTGSTDRTVEIAEEMGAKVFRFDWCDDFSAAKNYAIGLAGGDWIAFLDADEYFTGKDAEKLPDILKQAEARREKPEVIRTAWMQLNDKGEVFAVSSQDRIFRNSGDIKYQMPIHESLYSVSKGTPIVWNLETELSVIHTGYAPSALREAKKGERNIRLLRQMLETNPDNYEAWSYLGDALAADGQVDEAMQAVERVIEQGSGIENQSRVAEAYALWFQCIGFMGKRTLKLKAYEYYRRFCKTGLVYPDVEYRMGRYLAGLGESDEAVRFLEQALMNLERFQMIGTPQLPGDLKMVYGYLISEYQIRKNPSKVVYYATLDLRLDPYQENALEPLIGCLKEDRNTTPEQVLPLLAKLYDFSNLKDKLFILKAAKLQGYAELEPLIRREMTWEENAWLNSNGEPDWMLSWEETKNAYPQIPVCNRTDLNFLNLIRELRYEKRETLEQKAAASFRIDEGRFHTEDFVELYRRLEDYRSKQCLYGLLEYWLHQELRVLNLVRENGLQFWDLDLIPTAEAADCVTIGKYTKEAVNGFLYAYGDVYRHIHCFIDQDEEKPALDDIRDLSLQSADFSAFSPDGVSKEDLGILRIDTERDLLRILAGCEEHIDCAHPKMAICMDGDISNYWKVPQYIKSVSHEYQLYLRCYGKENIRFVLYAV